MTETLESQFRTNKEIKDICLEQIEKIKACMKTGGHVPLNGPVLELRNYNQYQCAKCGVFYED